VVNTLLRVQQHGSEPRVDQRMVDDPLTQQRLDRSCGQPNAAVGLTAFSPWAGVLPTRPNSGAVSEAPAKKCTVSERGELVCVTSCSRPSWRRISTDRMLMARPRGNGKASRCRSTSSTYTTHTASSRASTKPTGPPPQTTGGCIGYGVSAGLAASCTWTRRRLL
jgi:hypothetical protein